ncbi:MAG: hypothetical protein ABFS02_01700 [Pseudomonadota bacterium]
MNKRAKNAIVGGEEVPALRMEERLHVATLSELMPPGTAFAGLGAG